MRIKLDKDTLAVEQKNYATKTGFTVYELDTWPNISLNNFTLKNCLFGAKYNIVKTSDKEKWVYGGYRIRFEGACS